MISGCLHTERSRRRRTKNWAVDSEWPSPGALHRTVGCRLRVACLELCPGYGHVFAVQSDHGRYNNKLPSFNGQNILSLQLLFAFDW